MSITPAVKKALTKLSRGEKLNLQTSIVTIESALNQGLMFWDAFVGYKLTDAGKSVL